jgi:hypothetical protein
VAYLILWLRKNDHLFLPHYLVPLSLCGKKIKMSSSMTCDAFQELRGKTWTSGEGEESVLFGAEGELVRAS